jgi:hypothetical protein
LSACGLGIGSASAMPVNNFAPSVAPAAHIDQVRWVCGPRRCWWRPGPRVWHPRPYWRGHGWRDRRWHRRHW